MTHRQTVIATLLEWYEAVLNSWQDGTASDPFGTQRVNKILLHPSYRELERLLPELRSAEPVTYWNLAQRYWLAPSKQVLRCPRCGPAPEPPKEDRDRADKMLEYATVYALLHHRDVALPAFGVDVDHKHGRDLVALRPVRVRVPSQAIRPELVERAIGWLDEHWQGEPFIPDFDKRQKVAA